MPSSPDVLEMVALENVIVSLGAAALALGATEAVEPDELLDRTRALPGGGVDHALECVGLVDTAALRPLRIVANGGNGCAGPVVRALADRLPGIAHQPHQVGGKRIDGGHWYRCRKLHADHLHPYNWAIGVSLGKDFVINTTQAQVESKYGSPVSKKAAVGDPPISRWEYQGFTVYFENDRVIHAVLKR